MKLILRVRLRPLVPIRSHLADAICRFAAPSCDTETHDALARHREDTVSSAKMQTKAGVEEEGGKHSTQS